LYISAKKVLCMHPITCYQSREKWLDACVKLVYNYNAYELKSIKKGVIIKIDLPVEDWGCSQV